MQGSFDGLGCVDGPLFRMRITWTVILEKLPTHRESVITFVARHPTSPDRRGSVDGDIHGARAEMGRHTTAVPLPEVRGEGRRERLLAREVAIAYIVVGPVG